MSEASPSAVSAGRRLFGRERERGVLDRLLEGVRGGRAGALVIDGEPGVGKTALLDYTAAAAQEFRVAQTSGVEDEMELPFAAVHQLCSPFLEFMARLPRPQREALGGAFGLRGGAAPSQFLVGLAVLGLLAEAAEQQPLACVVDDAQWLDTASARTLAFVARRLLAERIALVFATREPGDPLGGLPELHIGPLSRRDARALLDSVLPARLDESVLERIVAETRGNPLALLELPRGLTPAQLAGGFGLPATGPLSDAIEDGYTRRLATLPSDVRRLLLVAAADPTGDPALVWRTACLLGITEPAARILESEDLLALSPRVVFRHPLVRSAVYRSAALAERREIHRALAQATDPETEPDRRAWHRAQAALVPDEQLADELERSAARAQERGGLAAAAAFLERAAALSPEPSRRAQRAIAGAQAHFRAGALDDALDLLKTVESGAALDDLLHAHVHVLRAQVAFVSSHGSDAPPLLLETARRLEGLDLRLARETYLDALSAAMFAGCMARPGAGVREVAHAARTAPASAHPPRVPDLLLDGFATLFSQGYRPAVPILRQAQSAFSADLPIAEQLRWLWLAAISYDLLWEDRQWEALCVRHVQLARETGALGELAPALNHRVYVHLFAGELAAAASLVEQIQAAIEATDSNLAAYGAVGLAALRGREAEAASLINASRADVTRRGEGIGISILDWGEAVLYNGLCRYEEACAAAQRATEHPDDLGSSNWWMAELIEAATRAGRPELAAQTHRRLLEMTEASGSEWGRGLEARSRALLVDGDAAETLHLEAIERLARTRMGVDLARAHLLYGERLRRQRRRLEARHELRIAYQMFTGFGTEAFAERARVELEATGEHARKRTVQTLDQLTAQELQVARLAAQGETNREIAARLFISASTVEYHLRKAFRKLDVKSRTQLQDRLSEQSP